MVPANEIENIIKEKESEILKNWVNAQLIGPKRRQDLIANEDLKRESIDFLREFVKAIRKGELVDIDSPDFEKIITFLKNLSKKRALAGFSPSETATYVFSLKGILMPIIQEAYKSDLDRVNKEIIRINLLIDKLGLITFEEFVREREALIRDQAEAMLELSSPIVTLWEKILTIPIIGTLDSNRTQVIMENLLNKIVDTGSKIAIIDITGVGIMDTQVANHILKTVTAVKLLGAEAIITGIRPEVAQTIVTLGVDLQDITTRASLADGIDYAFRQLNYRVVKG